MNNSKKIGILYKYDPNWMGGTIYVFNLLKALELSEINGINLPKIIIFISRFNQKKLDFNFPRLKYKIEYYDSPKWITFLNVVTLKTIGKKLIDWRYNSELDSLFPVTRSWNYFKKTPIGSQVYWIPDFQCFHLPEYFDKNDIEARKQSYLRIIETSKKLVLSSVTVYNDLLKFYKNVKLPQIGILKFAVFNELKIKNSDSVNLDKPYYICPNQFWAHKNQIIILQAIKHLGNCDLPFYVVFTGKMFDPRKPSYFIDNIKPLLDDDFVKNNVKMLGFVERDFQFNLLKNAIALIQPSRFEGWSTVIEDGMFFNLKIMASNLEVNKEQLGGKGIFFDVDDKIKLSKLLMEHFDMHPKYTEYNYENKQLSFALDFLKIIDL